MKAVRCAVGTGFSVVFAALLGCERGSVLSLTNPQVTHEAIADVVKRELYVRNLGVDPFQPASERVPGACLPQPAGRDAAALLCRRIEVLICGEGCLNLKMERALVAGRANEIMDRIRNPCRMLADPKSESENAERIHPPGFYLPYGKSYDALRCGSGKEVQAEVQEVVDDTDREKIGFRIEFK